MTIPTELAARLGLHRSGREWRGGCPLCGYRDSLVLGSGRNGAPILWCASCDDRDGLRALLRGSGAMLSDYPRPHFPDHRPRRTDSRNTPSGKASAEQRERALGLWRGSRPAAGTLADRYLTARGLPGLANSPALRFRSDCWHEETHSNHPALVALITDTDDRPLGIHRTYLRRDGSGKAEIEPARKSLGPIWGGAVRLGPAAPELAVGEGIESSAAAGRLLNRPSWAA
ncbi:MAG: virulence-associated protein E, partial [Alphaproteobacteria bacterium]|nr:virulence-associated protein E [Alphaproteobacteria bacterium]